MAQLNTFFSILGGHAVPILPSVSVISRTPSPTLCVCFAFPNSHMYLCSAESSGGCGMKMFVPPSLGEAPSHHNAARKRNDVLTFLQLPAEVGKNVARRLRTASSSLAIHDVDGGLGPALLGKFHATGRSWPSTPHLPRILKGTENKRLARATQERRILTRTEQGHRTKRKKEGKQRRKPI